MEDVKELVRRAIDSYNAHTLEFDYTEDAELVNPVRGRINGRQAIMDFWKEQIETFPDARVTVDRMLSEGDSVALEYTFAGTNTGPLRLPTGETISATNKRITGPALDILTFRDGKLLSHHQYFDQVPVLAQLGLMPAPIGAPA